MVERALKVMKFGGTSVGVFKAVRFVAAREGFQLPNARLVMRNEIPLASVDS